MSAKDLGMDRPVTRRDFLNGVALGAAGLLGAPRWLRALEPGGGEEPAPQEAAGYYPPALTGLRGSHEGSFEAAHALRDGTLWETVGAAADTGESYDLVVVGGGISGLSAAHFFRKATGASARILILDNHDDFGGHAKRNEFREGGRLLLGYGGTYAIDSPAPYSRVAHGLVAELGIDVHRSARVLDGKLYSSLGLKPALFFDKETFGVDRLLPDPAASAGGESRDERTDAAAWRRFMAEAPLAEAARQDLRRLYTEPRDYMPGLSSSEKKARLAQMSYADYLTRVARVDPGVLPVLAARPHSLYGVGIDAVPAQDAWGLGLPGFRGLGLDRRPGPGMGRDAIPSPEAEEYFFHFPDGNASLARLLVRSLIPPALPGTGMDDVVLARARYAALDEPGSAVRLRLGSTVVRVRHSGGPAPGEGVEVAYVRGGALRTVRARGCILACWATVIPYLCPELPEAQKEALAYEVKVPIVYTNVLIRNWTSFLKLGVRTIHAPGGYHTHLNLDLPVSLGGYHAPRSPEDPMVLHLMRTPCSPGLPAREQHRAGRAELFGTPFSTFEREIRDQLGRILGPGGFDPAGDIRAITVNRWPHGYAYQYNSLFDPFWLSGDPAAQPCLTARKPFGRLAIANADSAAYAYTDAAIDEAHRAVQEILGPAVGRPR